MYPKKVWRNKRKIKGMPRNQKIEKINNLGKGGHLGKVVWIYYIYIYIYKKISDNNRKDVDVMKTFSK